LKENADDYRYFPEPDIPPIRFTPEYIQLLGNSLPELPDQKQLRYSKEYQLNSYDSGILTETRAIADFFEEAVRVAKKTSSSITPKHIANWIINRKLSPEKIVPAELIESIRKSVEVVGISSDEYNPLVKSVIESNPQAVADYRKGKEQAFMFLVGQAMKLSKGKVNVDILMPIFRKLLTST